jgi:hypothetical protein
MIYLVIQVPRLFTELCRGSARAQRCHLECVSMGCLNWRESRAEGRAEQKSSDLIPVQARDWLSRKRNPVRPPVSPVPAKPIFKEGMLEGRLDPHVQFQSPMEDFSASPLLGY